MGYDGAFTLCWRHSSIGCRLCAGVDKLIVKFCEELVVVQWGGYGRHGRGATGGGSTEMGGGGRGTVVGSGLRGAAI